MAFGLAGCNRREHSNQTDVLLANVVRVSNWGYYRRAWVFKASLHPVVFKFPRKAAPADNARNFLSIASLEIKMTHFQT